MRSVEIEESVKSSLSDPSEKHSQVAEAEMLGRGFLLHVPTAADGTGLVPMVADRTRLLIVGLKVSAVGGRKGRTDCS